MRTRHAVLIPAAVLAAAAGPFIRAESPKRLLACEFPFDRDASAATLSKHFGASNVTQAEIGIGEGDTEMGTALFAGSPLDRVEILWTDKTTQSKPRWVLLRGDANLDRPKSRWHTAAGLTLGMDLRTVARLNRRPFRLLGFGWDYQGTVVSWGGGDLESKQSQTCRVGATLWPAETLDPNQDHLYLQVSGDREFSSGHPAMQAVNPFVHEIALDYRPAR